MELLKRWRSENKYLAFTLLYIGFCISYADRAAINIALTAVGQDFSLTPAIMGAVISIFYIGYAIMQIPGGLLADKFGSKKVIIFTLFLWSIFTLFTGFAWSLVSLLVIRFFFGLGEGAFPPATFKGIAEYFRKDERPKMTGALVSSNYIGSAIAPLLVVPLMLAFGWRGMFHALGVIGLMYIAIYWFFIEQKKVTEEKNENSNENSSNNGNKMNFKTLLKMPLIWQLLIAWFALSLINKGLDSWMPTYLLTVRHLDLKSVGILMPLPFIAAGISTGIGGWVMDRFFDKKEKYLIAFCAICTAIFLYFMYTAETIAMVITFQCLVYFFKSCVLATTMALPMKLLPGTVVGSATGLINFGGQSAGFISPVIIGVIITAFNGSYDAVFLFLIGAACCSALASLTIKHRDNNTFTVN